MNGGESVNKSVEMFKLAEETVQEYIFDDASNSWSPVSAAPRQTAAESGHRHNSSKNRQPRSHSERLLITAAGEALPFSPSIAPTKNFALLQPKVVLAPANCELVAFPIDENVQSNEFLVNIEVTKAYESKKLKSFFGSKLAGKVSPEMGLKTNIDPTAFDEFKSKLDHTTIPEFVDSISLNYKELPPKNDKRNNKTKKKKHQISYQNTNINHLASSIENDAQNLSNPTTNKGSSLKMIVQPQLIGSEFSIPFSPRHMEGISSNEPNHTRNIKFASVPNSPFAGHPALVNHESTNLQPLYMNSPIEIGFGKPILQDSAITVGENERIAAIHFLGILDIPDHSRLNKITQMTLRLLGGSCCILSIVDVDRVIWKSCSWSSNVKQFAAAEEARYESFCSWVVQDETGRGVTILDMRSDPRCVHMRPKSGLEFYAGVPLITSDRKRIGTLNIRGPARSQISVIDMNILHEMAAWASGEIDTIAQHRSLEIKDKMLEARFALNTIVEESRNTEKEMPTTLMEKALNTVRDSLNASFVLILRISTDVSGYFFILI